MTGWLHWNDQKIFWDIKDQILIFEFSPAIGRAASIFKVHGRIHWPVTLHRHTAGLRLCPVWSPVDPDTHTSIIWLILIQHISLSEVTWDRSGIRLSSPAVRLTSLRCAHLRVSAQPSCCRLCFDEAFSSLISWLWFMTGCFTPTQQAAEKTTFSSLLLVTWHSQLWVDPEGISSLCPL